jgi:hypothetical protein
MPNTIAAARTATFSAHLQNFSTRLLSWSLFRFGVLRPGVLAEAGTGFLFTAFAFSSSTFRFAASVVWGAIIQWRISYPRPPQALGCANNIYPTQAITIATIDGVTFAVRLRIHQLSSRWGACKSKQRCQIGTILQGSPVLLIMTVLGKVAEPSCSNYSRFNPLPSLQHVRARISLE